MKDSILILNLTLGHIEKLLEGPAQHHPGEQCSSGNVLYLHYPLWEPPATHAYGALEMWLVQLTD